MKTIIVPTDFSGNAEAALNYTLEFAKKENALLIVLHAYQVNYPSAETPYSLIEEIKSDAQKKAARELKDWCSKFIKGNDIQYIPMAIEGDPKHLIVDIAKEKKADLIVMGTKGAGSVLNQVFGSTAAKIIEKAICPVIAVPQEAILRSPKRITYATDYLNSDISNLKNVIDIAKLFSAQVNILHVANEGQSPGDDVKMLKNFMEKVNTEIFYNNTSFQILGGDNVEQALENYLQDNPSDILAMSAHHRTLFDKILGKSITKHMAYHSTIPLMVFHYNKESSLKLI